MNSLFALAGLYLSLTVGFSQSDRTANLLEKYKKDLKANPQSSLAHFRIGEIFFKQKQYADAVNKFRQALDGDLQPKWTKVWSYIDCGKIFDVTGQRERAVNEYKQAVRTRDNTRGALDEAAKYLRSPYDGK